MPSGLGLCGGLEAVGHRSFLESAIGIALLMSDKQPSILNLDPYEVTNFKEDAHDYQFNVDAGEPFGCQSCGSIGDLVRFGKRDVGYKDLPIHGKRVTLWVVRRRYKCKACGATFRPDLPGMDERRRMTLRLADYVWRQSLVRTNSDVARETGMDEKTVREIFGEKAGELSKEFRFETPEVLGIDELYLNRKYRCILTNIKHQTMLDMLPNRNRMMVTAYLSRLPDKHRVRVVSMDMWNPYRDAVRTAIPDAKIVVDKFHVVRMANDALEKVRKGLKGSLTAKQRRTLKGDRKLMLMRERDIDERGRLLMETWTNAFPELLAAYRAKEAFYDIWETADQWTARDRFEEWKASIPSGQKAVWGDLVRAAENWWPEIHAYFELGSGVTNAFTESLNRLAKDRNRDSRGYSFEVLRVKLLYTKGHKVVTPKRPRQSPFEMSRSISYSGFMAREEPTNYGVPLSTVLHALKYGDDEDPNNH